MSSAPTVTVPIFPLDGVLLVPGFPMQFYVFEPRYREMLAWALEHDRRIAVAVPQPGHSIQEEHQPPVFPIAGLGEIAAHEPLENGHANIELHGIGRIRIVEELPQAFEFRLVQAEPLAERPVEDPAEKSEFAAGVETVRRSLYVRHPEATGHLDELTAQQVIDAALVALPVELNTKLYLFAELDLGRRLRLLLQCLGEEQAAAEDFGPDDPRRN